MKDLTRWFLGEDLGNLTINGWQWLWAMPPHGSSATTKTSDDLILADIARSIEDVRAIVLQIRGAVERVMSDTKEIQERYDLKCRRHNALIGMSLTFDRQGKILEARSAMAQAIQLEHVISEWQKRVEISKGLLMSAREIYDRRFDILSLLEVDLQMIKTQKDMNNSIGSDRSPDLILLQEKLSIIRVDTEETYDRIQIEIKLSHSSNCRLETTLNDDDLDKRIRELDELS
jgi:hypothetical protein